MAAGLTHPRVRGDVGPARDAALPCIRAHPRACAGTSVSEGTDVLVKGLTPACAGTSRELANPVGGVPRAHPRVRGDVTHLSEPHLHLPGSPPRARGRRRGDRGGRQGAQDRRAHPRVRGDVSVHWLCDVRPVIVPRAHPRVRGDVQADLVAGLLGAGSPPRARGRPAWRPGRRGRKRAHPRVRGDVDTWAHPRARGSLAVRGDACAGTSSRARGRLDGLTPACAGTSTKTSTSCQTARAHPRVRGDVSENPWRRHLQKGSPPRARGRRRPVSVREKI